MDFWPVTSLVPKQQEDQCQSHKCSLILNVIYCSDASRTVLVYSLNDLTSFCRGGAMERVLLEISESVNSDSSGAELKHDHLRSELFTVLSPAVLMMFYAAVTFLFCVGLLCSSVRDRGRQTQRRWGEQVILGGECEGYS